jgi:hypothetical protein
VPAIAVLFSLLDLIVGGAFAVPHLALFRHRESRWDSPLRRRRGLAVILGGIEGPSLVQHAMAAGLLRGGWRGAVRIERWNAGVPLIRCALNLMSRARHERTSDALVRTILEHRREYPQSPTVILAVSGGCWIAVRALEKLGSATPVDAVTLLAPAISRAHDMDASLRAARAGILVVRSPYDLVLLGLGTTLLGTSDRRFGWSAGSQGFAAADERLGERLWRRTDVRYGYFGSHCTVIAPRFVAHEITPWMRSACR